MAILFKPFSKQKREYLFYDADNNVVNASHIDSLTEPDKSYRQGLYDEWLEMEKENERAWRNYELLHTDWMLVSDATYAGETLATSPKHQDILTYRESLRSYNLTSEGRPTRPSWYLTEDIG